MKRIYFMVFLEICLAMSAQATVINVPDDYPLIQTAIESAVDGDTVLVAPGRYYENIIFHGKNVVLTSNYLFSKDPTDILQTILDGSHYVNADSASVIAMYHNENATAAVIGFVVTGGNGCIVFNPREGGGINLDRASPLIKNNIIVGNWASIPASTGKYRGGGGINMRHSNAHFIGNYVLSNSGFDYCGGILVQSSHIVANNNVIAYNNGGSRLGVYGGGGGVYVYQGSTNSFENNTIAYNTAGRAGGFHAVSGGIATLHNNILHANTNGQIVLTNTSSSGVAATYCDVMGGYTGFGNTDLDPLWNSDITLSSGSPLIDLGDPDSLYNDLEDGAGSGIALSPSLGSTRNDMGAFGGADAIFQIPLPTLNGPVISFGATSLTFLDDSASTPHEIKIPVANGGLGVAWVNYLLNTSSSATLQFSAAKSILLLNQDTLTFTWTPQGLSPFTDTILIFHNDPAYGSPARFIIDYSRVSCCTTPGDGNADGSYDITDITYLLSYIFTNGSAPDCNDQADTTGDNSISIIDVTYGLARIFTGGPPPICGTTGH